MDRPVTIIGGGLAGCEAAYQLLRRGLPVRLYEMRPGKTTPAHKGGGLAELVCSNSLRAASVENAVGLLKEEMRRLGSLIMEAADATAVPAGSALAVDRHKFSAFIEERLTAFPGLELIRQEVTFLPEGEVIIAAGPLASPGLSRVIANLTGREQLFFHDAIAPIVDASTIDMEKAFFASRYGKGEGSDYLNCPFDKEQYLAFYYELVNAQVHPLHDFEKEKHFSGCMPIESMARFGPETICHGPLKPVGLELPSGGEAYAVVQLRKENIEGSMYNLVGFQTRLTQGEQRRVFRMIPGLEQAEFLRYGAMHRNTYIDSPKLLTEDLRLIAEPRLSFAGQITGVEGYVESAASGLMAGIFAAYRRLGLERPVFPRESALGSLLAFTHTPKDDFQPMNVNFGLFPPLLTQFRSKKEKFSLLSQRALESIDSFKAELR
ncbi:MAG: methylenetetrahydrofolate--tRNA-(uracil(54)-C(5))-methyltransferase (FADH(2)-oxidizing) TrmFO [Firmicutes bacterium]|nr:methylenetetrahydrofolate--tRNA-(uracil(54)-C(5))-methyltransferase (FADH(2)-oxidizing) TrmFO [Bacillota bacterium]